jgi:hypothetical protein
MSAMWLGARGTVTADTIKFFAMGLPFLFVGTWLDLGLGAGARRRSGGSRMGLIVPFGAGSLVLFATSARHGRWSHWPSVAYRSGGSCSQTSSGWTCRVSST